MRKEELKLFENLELGKVRSMTEDGKEYFVAKDIALILGYKNTNKAIKDHCRKQITRRVEFIDAVGRKQSQLAVFITNGDIYRLIARSKLPSAERFESWVFDEIIPSLVENNYYVASTITYDQLKRLKEELKQYETVEQILLSVEDYQVEDVYKLIQSHRKDKKTLDKQILRAIDKRPLGVVTQALEIRLLKDKIKSISKINTKKTKQIKELKDKSEPLEMEYTCITYHGFTFNKQYEAQDNEFVRTQVYNGWLENFPVEQLPSVDGIDFTKKVDIWLKFDHLEKFDVSNFHKSILDKACKHWGVDDKYVQLKNCVTNNYCKNLKDGRIYICIKQSKVL